MPVWKKAGKLAVSAVDDLKKLVGDAKKTPDVPAPFVLIDLRPKADVAKGYIPFATSMTAEEVVDRVPEFPKYKKARIILYTQNETDKGALDAIKQLRTWKYKVPSVLTGGFDAWQKAGGKVAKGEPATKIAFKKKPAKDEISLAEFKEIMAKKPGNKVLLDVRSAQEFNEGSIPGSKNMALEAIQVDVSKLPKDKEIITYCNTGAICSIADKVLKKKGFKSRYLNATITYKDGKVNIEE
jgi:rhodanese-related sulfurtransferase